MKTGQLRHVLRNCFLSLALLRLSASCPLCALSHSCFHMVQAPSLPFSQSFPLAEASLYGPTCASPFHRRVLFHADVVLPGTPQSFCHTACHLPKEDRGSFSGLCLMRAEQAISPSPCTSNTHQCFPFF